MKKIFSLLIICLLLALPSIAQTLGDALKDVADQSKAVATRQTGQTWGVQTAVEDLTKLQNESQRLLDSLSVSDARDVKSLEEGLKSSIRRVRTSKVMLSESDQAELESVLVTANQVASRLSGLRLRLGGKANMVSGKLAALSLEPGDSELGYENLQDLLIDVRWTRDLVSALMPARFPQPGGIGFNQPNNLDPLEVERVRLALWNLERTLSTNLDDVQQSVPAWQNFKQEYNRLNYMGAGRTVRMLEKAVNRMDDFYSSLEI